MLTILSVIAGAFASDVLQNDDGYYFDFCVLLPQAMIDHFLTFEVVEGFEPVQGEEGTVVSRIYLNDYQPEFQTYLRNIDQMQKVNYAFAEEFPISSRMPVCYWDYGLQTEVACYVYNKEMICVDNDGMCDYE